MRVSEARHKENVIEFGKPVIFQSSNPATYLLRNTLLCPSSRLKNPPPFYKKIHSQIQTTGYTSLISIRKLTGTQRHNVRSEVAESFLSCE